LESQVVEEVKTYNELIEQIRKNLNDNERFAKKLEWVKEMVKHYSEKLGFSELEILTAFEKRRDYWSANYYQEANFPRLDGVDVYENFEEVMKRFPSKQFICPRCNGISTNPYECNSGKEMDKNKICDWKSYGLFRTLNGGYRFTIKDSFLEKPFVDNIFKPIEIVN